MSQTKPLYVIPSISNFCKFLNQENLENNNQLDILRNNINSYKNINILENTKKNIKKKSSESFHIYSKSDQLKLLHKSINNIVNETKTIECEKKNYIENLLYKYH